MELFGLDSKEVDPFGRVGWTTDSTVRDQISVILQTIVSDGLSIQSHAHLYDLIEPKAGD